MRDSYRVISDRNIEREKIYNSIKEEEYHTGIVSYLDVTIQPITRSYIIKRSKRMKLKTLNRTLYGRNIEGAINHSRPGRKRCTVYNSIYMRYLPIEKFNRYSFDTSVGYLNRD